MELLFPKLKKTVGSTCLGSCDGGNLGNGTTVRRKRSMLINTEIRRGKCTQSSAFEDVTFEDVTLRM